MTSLTIPIEDTINAQGQADVAQSIYNRLGSKAYQKNSITDLILDRNQYEPTWRFPNGPENGIGNPNWVWSNITNITAASKATGLDNNLLFRVAKSIQNINLQRQVWNEEVPRDREDDAIVYQY